jgi:hypothetical protein
VSHYILQDPLKDHLYIIVQTLNADKLSCWRHSLLCCSSFDNPTQTCTSVLTCPTPLLILNVHGLIMSKNCVSIVAVV